MWYAGFNVIMTNKLMYPVTSLKLKDVNCCLFQENEKSVDLR